MALAHWFRTRFMRHTSTNGALDPDEFIRTRREALSRMTPEDIDRMTDAALATLDREKTLREIEDLQEHWVERAQGSTD